MQFLGRSSSTISGEPIPSNGEVLARWSSQEEEHAHTIRKRARAWGVRRTKLHAFGARGGLEHRALGPSQLARVGFGFLWQVPKVTEAAAPGQHQGLSVSCLVK